MPESVDVDLRARFARRGLVLKAQGKRPTCAVFAVTAGIEYAVSCTGRKGLLLSEEYLNWASNDAIQEYEDGGFFSDLWLGLQKHGIASAEECPYQAQFDPAFTPADEAQASALKPGSLSLRWIKEWDVETGLTDEHIAAIRRALEAGFPVCAGLRWPKQPAWRRGLLVMCGPNEVFDGHSILIVGYRGTDPRASWFRIKDSAGGAYRRLPTEYVAAYANDACVITPVTA